MSNQVISSLGGLTRPIMNVNCVSKFSSPFFRGSVKSATIWAESVRDINILASSSSSSSSSPCSFHSFPTPSLLTYPQPLLATQKIVKTISSGQVRGMSSTATAHSNSPERKADDEPEEEKVKTSGQGRGQGRPVRPKKDVIVVVRPTRPLFVCSRFVFQCLVTELGYQRLNRSSLL